MTFCVSTWSGKNTGAISWNGKAPWLTRVIWDGWYIVEVSSIWCTVHGVADTAYPKKWQRHLYNFLAARVYWKNDGLCRSKQRHRDIASNKHCDWCGDLQTLCRTPIYHPAIRRSALMLLVPQNWQRHFHQFWQHFSPIKSFNRNWVHDVQCWRRWRRWRR